MVEPGPAFDADHLDRLLAPHLGRLSALVVVLLRHDPVRGGFVDRVRAQGLGVRTLVVKEGSGIETLDPDTTEVGLRDLTEERLAL